MRWGKFLQDITEWLGKQASLKGDTAVSEITRSPRIITRIDRASTKALSTIIQLC